MNRPVTLVHRTSYHYDRPVFLGPQTIRLRPHATCPTPIVSYAMDIAPHDHHRTWRHDDFGNHEAHVTFDRQVRDFDITVRLTADLAPATGSAPCAELIPTPAPALAAFMTPQAAGPHLRAFVAEAASIHTADPCARLAAINRMIATRTTYRTRMEAGVWDAEETLGRQTGSCRDSAWLFIQVLRHMGIPARFVSGYLIQPDASGTTCDLHAWAQAHIPDIGWVGFDTTSGLLTSRGHIALAAAAHPEQVAPVSGLLDSCNATLDVSMTLHHAGRSDNTKAHEIKAQKIKDCHDPHGNAIS